MKFERHPRTAPGDFYVADRCCVSCGAPQVAAPDLIGWADPHTLDHCVWKKQPETPSELEQAFAAFDASCVACFRYAGTDRSIMKRVGLEQCDKASRVRLVIRSIARRLLLFLLRISD